MLLRDIVWTTCLLPPCRETANLLLFILCDALGQYAAVVHTIVTSLFF